MCVTISELTHTHASSDQVVESGYCGVLHRLFGSPTPHTCSDHVEGEDIVRCVYLLVGSPTTPTCSDNVVRLGCSGCV